MAASLTADEVPKLTVVALREQLAARGLDKKGLKAELVARLTHALLHPSREADGGDDPAEADGGTATATAARPQSLRTQRSAPPGAAPEADDADGDLPVRRLSPAFGTLADSPVAGLVEPSAVVHKRGGGGVPAATPFHPAQHDSDGTPGTGLASWVRNSLDSLTKLGTAWGAYLAGSPRGQVQQQQQGGPAPKMLPAAKRDLNTGAPVPVAPGVRRVGVVAPAVISRLGWKPKTGPVDKKARNPTPRKYDAKASIAAKGKLPWGAAAVKKPAAAAAARPANKPAARPSPAKPAAARRATLAPGARLAGSKPFMPGGAAKRQSMAFVDAAAARSQQVNAARKRSLM